jgi:tRNA nucleotidyltransferase (CCA-adding enzyme)
VSEQAASAIRRQSEPDPMARHDEPGVSPPIPTPVRSLLDRLWAAGHAAYVVGGSLRDALLGREPADWDLATDARPERLLQLFPEASYENRFGTVGVPVGREVFQITTFRIDHDYADHRRPHRVEFGDSIELDLARRDFTVNAMAWGADAPNAEATGAEGPDAVATEPRLIDPFGGRSDVRLRLLRAVGDPDERFEEDALRMIRAVRLATTLSFEIEPRTLAGIARKADLVRHLSGERIASELDRLLAAPMPSVGLHLLETTGLLAGISAPLAAQRGVPQNKAEGEDLWDHTLRTVDAAPADRPTVRLAALLHDIGKPATFSEGHFHGHDAVGADVAGSLLVQLHYPRAVVERVMLLVRSHMFDYHAGWSDAAVRRFIKKVGASALDELLLLRAADNVGSGLPPDAAGLTEVRRRIDDQLAAEVALERSDLAVDGDDLITELGLRPGPQLGHVLDELLERVIAEPALNDRPSLLLLARTIAPEP